MQADDRAEYEAEKVKEIFTVVLGEQTRAAKLLEHIRYRTGLLLERRPEVFAFAHLTFQEYLAARAIHKGNRRSIDTERLVCTHNDGRWQEVIPLYCGQAPPPDARQVIEHLLSQLDTRSLSTVLAEAYLSAGPELSQDKAFRRRVLERIAIGAVGREPQSTLMRFSRDEVAPIANRAIGKIQSNYLSESHQWLLRNPERIQPEILAKRLRKWRSMSPFQAAESIHLLHAYGPDTVLVEMAANKDIYMAPGPSFDEFDESFNSQAEIALIGLSQQPFKSTASFSGIDAVFLQILRTLLSSPKEIHANFAFSDSLGRFLRKRCKAPLPHDRATWPEFAVLAKGLAGRLTTAMNRDQRRSGPVGIGENIALLNAWADTLDQAVAAGSGQQTAPKSKSKSAATTKPPSRKTTRRR